MTLGWRTAFLVLLVTGVASAQDVPELENEAQKQSYVLGVNFGRGLRQQGVDLEIAAFERGLADGLEARDTSLTDEEIHAVIAALRLELSQRQTEARTETLEAGKAEEEAFLASNRERAGVTALESGLQYRVLEAGSGRTPDLTDSVTWRYRGTLLDGTQFAGQETEERPTRLAIHKLIPGLQEALQLMPEGSKWEVFVPSRLAYGTKGLARRIPPNATLVFEVELVSVVAPGDSGIDEGSEAAAGDVSRLRFSFKLDSRLTGGTYGGARWISPARFMGTVGQDRVEVKADAIDVKGRPLGVRPVWTPSDPEMVTVSFDDGGVATLTVVRAGESRIEVSAGGVSETLSLVATRQGEAVLVEIAQPEHAGRTGS